MIKFFSASWCTACNNLKNLLSEEDLEGVVMVDADNQRDEVMRYDVRSIPTLIKVDEEGDPIDVKLGTMTRTQFLEFKNE